MKLGDSGEAFFVEEVDSDDELDDMNLATSPIPQSSPQHSDNDNNRLTQRRGTHESDDLNLGLIKNVNTINVNSLGDGSTTVTVSGDDATKLSSEVPLQPKSDDSKGRKRRKKRRTRAHVREILFLISCIG
jgi:hypothetical protein